MLIVAALTAVGVALRLAFAHQSLFADELSTRWMVAGRGLADVVSTVHTDAEITPPLYFVASWLTTQIELTPEHLRAPSLVAGAAAIPLVHLVGVRTVGRRAALVATALTACSPFMIFYSAEARGYELMVALVLLSTLALLLAVDGGRRRWWVVYAVCACAAVYSHYTSVFALAGQLLWLLWAHPEARRPALVASAAAAVAFLPWLSGLQGDLDAPTTEILSALQPFTPGHVRTAVAHWAIGYPYATPITRVWDLPGTVALILLGLALALGLVGLALRLRGGIRLRSLDRRVVLVFAIAAAVPAGEALGSVLGTNLFGTRNLAAAWPAFALCLALFLTAAGPRLGLVAATLAVACFAIGAVKMLDADFARPDYGRVVAFVERTGAPGDVVLDGASLSPAGVPTAFEVEFDRDRRIFQLDRDEVLYDPFRIVALAPPPAVVVRRAVAAAGGRRLYFVLLARAPAETVRELVGTLPAAYRRVDARTYPGITPLRVLVFERQTASGA